MHSIVTAQGVFKKPGSKVLTVRDWSGCSRHGYCAVCSDGAEEFRCSCNDPCTCKFVPLVATIEKEEDLERT